MWPESQIVAELRHVSSLVAFNIIQGETAGEGTILRCTPRNLFPQR